MDMLKGKVAIVTGSTSGMGKASAILFAKEGAKVVVVGRNVDRGESTAAAIKNNGGDAIFIRADATKEDDVKQLIDETIKTYGKIDVLYNVAGGGKQMPLETDTVENWNTTFDMNVITAFLMTKYAMPYLLETKGSIINTSSVAGVRAVMPNYSYAAANAGVIMMTKTYAKYYAAQGVRMNVIVPGLIDTPIWAQAPAELKKALADEIPMKRMGEAEEIASVALFLASDMSSYVTGQAICVDGAQSIV